MAKRGGVGRDAGIASGGQASRQESRYFRRTRAYLRAPRQAGSIRSILRLGERYTLTGLGLMDLLDRRRFRSRAFARAALCNQRRRARSTREREITRGIHGIYGSVLAHPVVSGFNCPISRGKCRCLSAVSH